MHYALEKQEYQIVLPLLSARPRDPMMYTVLEGHQAGQVLVDDRQHPRAALVWSGMEYAYLVGDNAVGFIEILNPYLENTMLPALQEAGINFVSVFSEGETIRQALLEGFAPRSPTSYGVDRYTFNTAQFKRQTKNLPPPPDGFTLVKLTKDQLEKPTFEHTRQDLEFCWESLDRFIELGLGWAVLHDGEVASACCAIAYGAEAYHINIWTTAKHRRRGLARLAAAAMIAEALEDGKTIYWLNDTPNSASRRLAESVGFVYAGELSPVDIPADPGPFHRGLAGHFADYLKDYAEAERLYQTALRFDPEDVDTLTGLKQVQTKRS